MTAYREGTRPSVVVTGASTGIGQASALRLDRAGLRVFAGVRRDEDGDHLRQQASDRLVPLRIDIADAASIATAVDTVADSLGDAGLAGLVNNAGIAVAGPLEYLPIDELRRQLEVNVTGHVAVIQAFLPLLRRGHGRIVNIGSLGGRVATPFLGPYSASKFALEALTTALRMELRPWGIAVSIVEPGSIATPIWEKSVAAGDRLIERLPPEVQERYGREIAAVRAYAGAMSRNGIPPAMVAQAVLHALTAPRPRRRYVVGRDARLAEVARLLPESLRDGLIMRFQGTVRSARRSRVV